MTRLISAAVLLVVLAAPAWAGFDEGLAAHDRGDYAYHMRGRGPAQLATDCLSPFGHGLPPCVLYSAFGGVGHRVRHSRSVIDFACMNRGR